MVLTGSWLVERVRNVAFSFAATQEKIDEVRDSHFPFGKDGEPASKDAMKQLCVITSDFNLFSHETAILALAKVIEDTQIDLKKVGDKFQFDPVKNHHGAHNLRELQKVKALANVIKHNGSYLMRNSSESAKFLVDDIGLPDDIEFRRLLAPLHDELDMYKIIPNVMIGLFSVIGKKYGIALPFPDQYNHEKVWDELLPEYVHVKHPNKQFKRDS